ncbi:MAG: bifunctional diaminohydroxyphosphoribosylaminopyrimidine deaminase/5-amino-6-(5-phosphoribosylamino)uracil reductase RibD [Melioribacteraceae bacterium]
MINSIDEKYIRLCFELAKKGEGFVSPNPLVGSVIVKDDNILATGFHNKYGSFHAERNAILSAQQNLSGATLYCNLEPCMHTGKQTPPCVPLIISHGIKKVVVSNLDTNPKVNGIGVQLLREAGIEVIPNILREAGEELNKFYFNVKKYGTPFVTMKIATSEDGMIAAEKGKQTWLTGDESRKFVHKLRAVYDAVLIGANTVNIDNPLLTVREVSGRNPKRIIIDGKLSSNLQSTLYNDLKAETFVFCSAEADEKRKADFKNKEIVLIELQSGFEGQLELTEILAEIVKLKINSVLIEGGGNIFEQFFTQGIFDELFLIKAPRNFINGVKSFDIRTNNEISLLNKMDLGVDTLFHYKNKRSKCLQD